MKNNIVGFALMCLIVPSVVYAGFSQDLSYGKQGDEVTLLQQFLREKGYYEGPVSGGFYSLTKSALITFQKSLNIEPATGFFGPITRNVVNYMLQSGSADAATNGMFVSPPVYQAPPTTTTQPPVTTSTQTTPPVVQTAPPTSGTPFVNPPVYQAPPTTPQTQTPTPTIPTSTTTDTKPPIIISLSVSSVTSTGAVIFWTTNESSDALVEYGITSFLGSQGPLDPTPTSKHIYTLSGLTPNTTYSYRVRSKDGSGNLVVSSIGTFKTSASTVTVTDTIPPSVPSGLKVTSSESTKAVLSWNASTDAVGVSQYRVYRGGVQITSVNATTYTDTGLTPSTSYQYQVAALDAAGNLSALSSPSVSVMTIAATTPVGTFKIGDTVRATVVTAVRATAVLTAPVLTTVPVNSMGIVTSGPVTVTGGTFWRVKYDIGAEGWSLESTLAKGTASPLDLSVSELNFGNTDISVKNPDKVLTVTNVSSSPVSIYGVSVSGTGFKVTQSTCSTLSPKASCEISVSFSPKTTAQSIGSLMISYTAAGSPLTVSLFGVGLNGDTISGKLKTTTSGLATADMVSGGEEPLYFDYIKPTGSAPFDRYVRGEGYRILKGVESVEAWFFTEGGAPVPCHPTFCSPVSVPEHMPIVYLTIDGVRVTGPQTLPYKFTLDTTKYADGVHILGADIISDDVPVVPMDISIIIDNVPGPVLGKQNFPNCTTKFGRTHGKAAYGCEWINYDPSVKLTGSPQKEPRVPVPFSTNLSSSELWAERMITSGTHIPRVLETPEGHPIISNKQQYYYWDISGLRGEEPPNLASIDGPRYVGTTGYIVDGYVDPTYHTLYAVSTHGRIVKVTPEGDVETIAGWRVKPGGVPPHGASGRADKADEYEIVGNFVDGPKNLFEPWGIVRDPRVTSANVFFVTDTLNHRIVKIDMRTSPATISTYAGSLTKTLGYRDGVGTAALFNEPWGIAITADGTLYVTDRLNHALRKIAPDGTVSTIFRSTRLAPTDGIGPGNRTPYRAGSLVPPARDAYMKDGPFDTATLVYPEALKFDSMGRLIVSENLIMALRRIDLTKKTIEWVSEVPVSTVGAGHTNINLDVDEKGTCGQKDDMFPASWVPTTAPFRVSATGVISPLYNGTAGMEAFQGRANGIKAFVYHWFTICGDDGSIWVAGGDQEGLMRLTKAKTTDLTANADEVITYLRGSQIYRDGTVPNFPLRPSFSLLYGFDGQTQWAGVPTFDQDGKLSDADLKALIKSGWRSAVGPRPEITGKDLNDLIFYIRRNCTDCLNSGNARMLPAPTDTVKPVITGIEVRDVTASTARVRWTTSEPTIGFVGFGRTAQLSRESDVESTYSTTHEMLLTDLASDALYLYTITVRDDAGNQTKTAVGTFNTTVGGPTVQPTLTFTADETSIKIGSSTMLRFTSKDATSCFATGGWSGEKPLSGSESTGPLTASKSYTLACTNPSGGLIQKTVTVTATAVADTVPPTVAISAPKEGETITGTFAVIADVTDDKGVGGATFYVDGIVAGQEDTLTPYAIALDTRLLTNGSHTVKAIARDTSGNRTTSAQVTFMVSNAVATTTSFVAVQSGSWMNTFTWKDGRVPRGTDDVVIPAGVTVTYDKPYDTNNSADAKTVTIQKSGTLTFSRTTSTRLDLDGNLVVKEGGMLDVGTPANPIPKDITAYIGFNVLTDRIFKGGSVVGPDPLYPHFQPIDTGLWVMGTGAQAHFHGAPIATAWTKLVADVKAGGTIITLKDLPAGWKVGDRIVVTPTGKDGKESEVRTISSITGATLTLSAPLTFDHAGRLKAANKTTGATRIITRETDVLSTEALIREQGEVGLLSRNVIITSNLVREGDPNHRAHVAYIHGATGEARYTEFRDLGPRGILGRYPLHLHHLGNTSTGFMIEGDSMWSSITDPMNKCIAVHVSNGVTLRNTVGYNAQGTCYYLEDAVEVANTVERNLGVGVIAPEEIPNTAVATRYSHDGTIGTIFWVREKNIFRNNVAAGGIGDTAGFWATPNGSTDAASTLFTQNESHSNRYGTYYSGKTELTIANDQAFIWNNTTGVNAVHAVNATTQNSLFWNNKDASSLPQPGTFLNNTIIPTEAVVVPPDTTAPVISNRAVSEITTSQATVSWETNEPATHIVEFGTTVLYGQSVSLTTLSTIPRASLTGLTPNTTYHYRVRSRDASGNESISNDGTFATAALPTVDTTPPVISKVTTSNITTSQATVSWETNESSTHKVEYGLTTAYGSVISLTVSTTSPRTLITGLTPDTVYHYRVRSRDASGNEALGTDVVFRTATLLRVDFTPPGQVRDLGVVENAARTFKLTWTATGDNGSIGTAKSYDIRYSKSPLTPNSWITATQIADEPVPQSAGAAEKYVLKDLTPDTGYYVGLRAYDAAGNGSTLSNIALGITTSDKTINPIPPTTPPGPTPVSPVPGMCGSANNQTFATAPTTNLCSSGTPSLVLANSSLGYSWQCFGVNGGTTATCSAKALQTTPPTTARPVLTSLDPVASSVTTATTFIRNLNVGSQGEDVRALQVFLNTHGFPIAQSGIGSPGQETTYYGNATMKAVALYQDANAAELVTPFGLLKGSGYFGDATRAKVNAHVSQHQH